LRELERLKYDFSRTSAARKIELLRQLERRRLPRAKQLHALHEFLNFSRAYPENEAILGTAERLLQQFDQRGDLQRFRAELSDTGIAGTAIHFRFFWLTAIWLARRYPEHLVIDWSEFDRRSRLESLFHLLVSYSETPALDEFGFSAREWLAALKGPAETDAAFLIRRFQALGVETPLREHLYEDLDVPVVLTPGASTPARGREKWDGAPIVFQRRPPQRSRPNLRQAIRAATFRVRSVERREARRLIELANACMVTRHRDLLVFLHADERDVRLIDYGDGLQFACMGAVPQRRLMLEAVYGFLTLMNGVPIGYVLCSALFNSSEVAYNVFETYRGAGAAHVYARVLAMVHQLFGAESFAIDPYQLGHDNAEGRESGAWWFYYKLGFRPHDPPVRALVREELRKLKANPRYRTGSRRLNQLAAEYMFLQLGRSRRDVLGRIGLGNIGLGVSRYLAQRFGADRERGIVVCAQEAARLLSLRSLDRLPAGERLAWQRWAPLVLALPGIRGWNTAQKKAVREVIRAKGGRRESDYVRLLDAHARLRRALLRLADQEA
jgi:hypothetical protein